MSEYYVMDRSGTVTTHFDERAKAVHFLIHALSGLAYQLRDERSVAAFYEKPPLVLVKKM